ncbi:MAG: molybdenum cofactor guanylyltransferase [Thermodesulfovibrionaceae bacterium]
MLWSSKIPLTAAVLAGGKSSRMGQDKCLLNLGSEKIIERLISTFSGCFEELFIVTNSPQFYFSFGLPLLGDIYSYRGPIAGIHVALKNSKYDVFAFACDMPFVKKEVIYALSEKHLIEKNLCTVSSFKGKIYPLPGVYSKTLQFQLENLLKEEKLSLKKLIDDIGCQAVEVENLDKEGVSFVNINTEEDLKIFIGG